MFEILEHLPLNQTIDLPDNIRSGFLLEDNEHIHFWTALSWYESDLASASQINSFHNQTLENVK